VPQRADAALLGDDGNLGEFRRGEVGVEDDFDIQWSIPSNSAYKDSYSCFP